MPSILTRRDIIATCGVAGAGMALGSPATAQQAAPEADWAIALNTSTIRPASLDDKIRAVEAAGYSGIEPWSNELDDYAKAGNSLESLGRRLADAGLSVPNIIGLWGCMPEADGDRPAALDRAKRQMEDAARVGAKHIAAVPTPDRPDIDPIWAGERYRELLEAGREFGVTPAVEFVGFFKGVSRLSQAVAIALEADHPAACLIADTFHLFRGGSGFNGVRQLAASSIACFHFNDAPTDPPREQQGDGHRVMPGDGSLPLVQLLRDLQGIGFTGPLSLELFNKAYWEQDPAEVARLGISRIRRLLEQSQVPA